MKRCWFLSYNSQDLALAQRLEALLKRKDPDAEIFFAPKSLRAGGYWLPRLAEAVAEATSFVLIVGEKGLGPWQILEYYEALDRRAKQPDFPLVFLLVEGQSAPGLPFLRQLHWIVTPDVASEQTVAKLLDAADGANGRPRQLWRYTAPYRGLTAMDESDSDFFFGRGAQTLEALAALQDDPVRLPILLGNSGVGKSSLAQAGVLAALKRQAWPESAGPSRPWPADLQGSRSWCFLTLRPGAEPLRALVEPFLRTWQFDPTDPRRENRRQEWIDGLGSGKLGLRSLLDATEDRLQELGQPKPSAFFLYVDQGEELYVRAEEVQRRRFSELLAGGLGDARLRALMSLRADFAGALQSDQSLYAVHRQINVPPLREAGLRDVVSRPAEILSARFESDSLAADLARRAAEESTKDAGALPLLSYLLDDMWMQMVKRGDGVLRLPMQAVELGGVLAERADDFLARHPKDEALLRRILTLKLATVREDGEPTRRRAARSEFSDAEWRLVCELADFPHRLLVTATMEGGETYAEVAHEAIFRRWNRLREWIAAEREFLIWKSELEAERRRWSAAPEASRNDALLMGLMLAKARSWVAQRGGDLPKADLEFVDLSSKREALEREQKERFRRRVHRAGAAALAVMTVLAAVAFVAFRHAESAKQTATRIQARYDVLKAAIVGTENKLRLPAYAHVTAAEIIADLKGTFGELDTGSFGALLQRGVDAKRIVWLDTAPQNNTNEAEAFRKMGFLVDQVTSIDAALEQLIRKKVDLIVTHFGYNPAGKMQSNAYRLRKAIGDGGFGHLPMIIYSVSVKDEFACDAQRDGFYDEVDKPAPLLQSAVRSVQGMPGPNRCRS